MAMASSSAQDSWLTGLQAFFEARDRSQLPMIAKYASMEPGALLSLLQMQHGMSSEFAQLLL
eukprot:33135-Karenia_brevis.AAC.1